MRRKKHIEELEQIKEIEEMADIIHEGDCPIVVLFYNDSLTLAENLYNKGYRKASDVARDIIRILRAAGIDKYRYPVIAEIEKKYLGEDINAPTKESEGEG